MTQFKGEYAGAALHSFLRGLKQAPQIITTILRKHGITEIDPNAWYDLETARSIYASVGKQVGSFSLTAVGSEMINTAKFPPAINDVTSALQSIQAAYLMSARGTNLGEITCDVKHDRRAVLVFSTPFPCALDKGIIQGCVKRFGGLPMIEHGIGCRDEGATSCTYTVNWM